MKSRHNRTKRVTKRSKIKRNRIKTKRKQRKTKKSKTKRSRIKNKKYSKQTKGGGKIGCGAPGCVIDGLKIDRRDNLKKILTKIFNRKMKGDDNSQQIANRNQDYNDEVKGYELLKRIPEETNFLPKMVRKLSLYINFGKNTGTNRIKDGVTIKVSVLSHTIPTDNDSVTLSEEDLGYRDIIDNIGGDRKLGFYPAIQITRVGKRDLEKYITYPQNPHKEIKGQIKVKDLDNIRVAYTKLIYNTFKYINSNNLIHNDIQLSNCTHTHPDMNTDKLHLIDIGQLTSYDVTKITETNYKVTINDENYEFNRNDMLSNPLTAELVHKYCMLSIPDNRGPELYVFLILVLCYSIKNNTLNDEMLEKLLYNLDGYNTLRNLSQYVEEMRTFDHKSSIKDYVQHVIKFFKSSNEEAVKNYIILGFKTSLKGIGLIDIMEQSFSDPLPDNLKTIIGNVNSKIDDWQKMDVTPYQKDENKLDSNEPMVIQHATQCVNIMLNMLMYCRNGQENYDFFLKGCNDLLATYFIGPRESGVEKIESLPGILGKDFYALGVTYLNIINTLYGNNHKDLYDKKDIDTKLELEDEILRNLVGLDLNIYHPENYIRASTFLKGLAIKKKARHNSLSSSNSETDTSGINTTNESNTSNTNSVTSANSFSSTRAVMGSPDTTRKSLN